jgi:hypothetical protein
LNTVAQSKPELPAAAPAAAPAAVIENVAETNGAPIEKEKKKKKDKLKGRKGSASPR